LNRSGPSRGFWLPVGVVLLGALEMVLLALWQRNGYWDFSDGVYAATARELLHGMTLYRAVAAAQPPPVYLVGTLLLALHDGPASLRTGLAVVDLATAALVAEAVWRLSGRRWLALAAGLAAPLLPITLHEHAQLIPETLAAPLILALAAACNLAFLLPALAVALFAASRRRALAALLGGGIVLGGVALAIYGSALWTETVTAQFAVGDATLHYVAGLVAQAAWNELPLVVGAVVALGALRAAERSSRVGADVLDTALLRTLVAAAGAGLLLSFTLFKYGSYIDVFVAAEPPLLALASLGAWLAWQRCGVALRLAVAAVLLLLVAQSASLLIAPDSAPIARRPGARSGLIEVSSPAAVSRAVAAARRCPATAAYSGPPYIAFLADRRLPGDQPDTFMLRYSSTDAAFARRAAVDVPRCPS
jgi:hypothetical protein